MRAACAYDPACLHSLGGPVCPLQPDEHAVIPLSERHRLDTALHGAPEFSDPVGEDLLGPPLRQAALEFPRAVGAGEGQLAYQPELRVKEPGEPQVHRFGEHPVDQTRPGENLQRSGLYRGSAGLSVRAGLTLDDAGLHPPTRKLYGREQPNARADYQYLDRSRHAHHCSSNVPPLIVSLRGVSDQALCVGD